MIYSKFSKTKESAGFTQLGFTLVELMVVITIVTVILTAMVSRQNTFQERFRVDSKVYDLAIAIRQAQAYTFGVREFYCSSNSTKTFDAAYGVHLNTANTDRFLSFVDANKDTKYNDTAEACYTQTTLLSAPGLNRICGVTGAGVKECYPGGGSSLRQATLTFQRPNPRPVMKFTTDDGTTEIPALQNHALTTMYVYFGYNNQSGEIELKVESTGQVSIKYCGATCP